MSIRMPIIYKLLLLSIFYTSFSLSSSDEGYGTRSSSDTHNCSFKTLESLTHLKMSIRCDNLDHIEISRPIKTIIPQEPFEVFPGLVAFGIHEEDYYHILINNVSVNIIDSEISAGWRESTASFAAPIGIIKSSVTIQNSKFILSDTPHTAGAIYLSADSSISCDNVTFTPINDLLKSVSLSHMRKPLSGAVLGKKRVNIILKNSLMSGAEGEKGNLVVETGSSITLKDSSFSSNIGNSASVLYGKDTDVLIDGCNFSGNQGLYGGVLTSKGSSEIIIKDTLFIGNMAERGAALNVNATIVKKSETATNIKVTKCIFSENFASDSGGAIYITGALVSIDESEVTENTAGVSGGGFFVKGSETVLFEKVKFQSNIVKGLLGIFEPHSGGGFYISDAESLVLNKIYLVRNRVSGMGGGAVIKNTKILNFTDCMIAENQADFEGGLSISDITDAYFYNTEFEKNEGKHGTGAVGIVRSGETVIFEDCKIRENIAETQGGLSVKDSNRLFITNTYIEHNLASMHDAGGVFLSNVVSSNFVSSNITQNAAVKNGGGALFSASDVLIKDCSFSFNLASESGGAIFSEVNGILQLSRTAFLNNTAMEGSGGAIMISTTSTVQAISLTVSHNTARNSGGGFFVSGFCSVLIQECLFSDNAAVTDNGGGLSLASVKSIFLERSSFKKNCAFSSGGAISINQISKNLAIKNVLFLENVAEGSGSSRGGAVHSAASGSLILETVKFVKNMAEEKGGALDVATSIRRSEGSTIKNVEFISNHILSGCGGAANFEDAFSLSIENSNFTSNSALSSGGALCVYDIHNINVRTCILSHNFLTSQTQPKNIKNTDITQRSQESRRLLIQNPIFQTSQSEDYKNFLMMNKSQVASLLCNSQSSNLMIEIANSIRSSSNDFNSIFGKNSKITVPLTVSGGAIDIQSVLSATFSDTKFIQNKSPGSAGAMALSDVNALVISHSIFSGNEAENFAGALSIAKMVVSSMSNIQFLGNTAGSIKTPSATGGSGGAVHVTNCRIAHFDNIDFFGNLAAGHGGALYIKEMEELHLSGVDFKVNGGYSGGAVILELVKNGVISDAVFESNVGLTRALQMQHIENINNNYNYKSLYNFDTLISAQIFFEDQSNDTVTVQKYLNNIRCEALEIIEYDNNRFERISVFDANEKLRDLSVQDGNENFDIKHLFNHFTKKELDQIPDNQNKQTYKNSEGEGDGDANGGGLSAINCDKLYIEKSLFSSNVASMSGGAFYVSGPGDIIINKVFATGNVASMKGGAISSKEANITIRSTIIRENLAMSGGSMAISSGYLQCNGVATMENEAQTSGGLLFCERSGNVSLHASNFKDDTSLVGNSVEAGCDCIITLIDSKVVCSMGNEDGCGLISTSSVSCKDNHGFVDGVILKSIINHWPFYTVLISVIFVIPLIIILFKCMIRGIGRCCESKRRRRNMNKESLLYGFENEIGNVWGPLSHQKLYKLRRQTLLNHDPSSWDTTCSLINTASLADDVSRPPSTLGYGNTSHSHFSMDPSVERLYTHRKWRYQHSRKSEYPASAASTSDMSSIMGNRDSYWRERDAQLVTDPEDEVVVADNNRVNNNNNNNNNNVPTYWNHLLARFIYPITVTTIDAFSDKDEKFEEL